MPRTILLTGGDRPGAIRFSDLLRGEYTVLETAGGAECISRLSLMHNTLCAVLLELYAPETEGWDTLARIAAVPDFADVPVIAVTGPGDDEAWKRALALGARDYVQFPPDAELLRRRLNDAVRARESVMCTLEPGQCLNERAMAERHTQERSRSLNEAMTRLMDDIPGGFVRMRVFPDGHSVPVYVNDGFARIVGMSAIEVMERYGNSSLWGVHPDDLPVVRDAVNEMLASGKAHSMKYRLRHGDGGYVWVRFFGRAAKAESGEVFFNVYYTEITEEEKRELSEREMLAVALTVMMQDSPNLAFVKDTERRYVYCSLPMAKLAGFNTTDELVGKTDREVLGEELAEEYAAFDRQVIESGKPVENVIVSLPDMEGKSRYASASKYPLRDSYGNVIGIYGIGRDVTEERTAYARLKLLTDSIPGGIAMYTVTPESIKIQYFSDGYFSLTGYTREEYFAMTEDDSMGLVFREDRQQMREAVMSILSGVDCFSCNYRASTKEGGYRWLHLQGTVLERREGEAVINAVKLDVTAQRQADEALRIRGEEYRIAIEQSGRLIYRYSHAENALIIPERTAAFFGLPERMKNVPESVIARGFIKPEDERAYREFYEGVRRGEPTGSMTLRRQIASGEWRWFAARSSTVYDNEGTPVSAIVLYEDITEEREQRVAGSLDHDRFLAALHTIYPVLISVNLTKDTYQVMTDSGSITRIEPLEGAIDQLVLSVTKRMEPEYANMLRDTFSPDNLMRAFAETGDSLRVEYRQVARDNKLHWVETTVIRTKNDYNSDITGVIVSRFVDAQKAMEYRLKQSERDGMTGLYNKTVTEKLITRNLMSAEGNCALLIVDLDDLKSINDKFGHIHGDNAIRLLSERLRASFRQSDIIGRVGGDEFVVFLNDISKAKVSEILTGFMIGLSAVRIGPERDISLRGSVGVAMGEGGAESYTSLFKKADKALYNVKRGGKGCFVFYEPEMEGRVVD